MIELKTVHCLVTGKVQGVWFRKYTQKKAKALKIVGWVRNLPDGSVEVKASAEPHILNEFIQWLHEGPSNARVDSVQVTGIAPENFSKFKVI